MRWLLIVALATRARRGADRKLTQTTQVVREKPIVIVHKRIVDDPQAGRVRGHLL